MLTSPVEWPLHGRFSRLEISKEKLMEFWAAMIRKAALRVHEREKVEDIRREPDGSFAVTTMLLGSLRSNGTWDKPSSMAIVAYCAGLAVLVLWSVLAEAGDSTLWGLSMAMGVIVYFVWPYTAVGAGLLYAFVFDRTIDEKRLAAAA